MNIDAYYKFQRIKEKSKTRFDLVEHKGYYEPLHQMNKKGESWIYLLNSNYIHYKEGRSTDATLTTRTGHLTSLFLLEATTPVKFFGDYDKDALLILLTDQVIEIFVFEGKKNIQPVINEIVLSGELDEQISRLTVSSATQLKLFNA